MRFELPDFPQFDTPALLSNMRIESALVHSRALLCFLTKQARGGEVAAADYFVRCALATGVADDDQEEGTAGRFPWLQRVPRVQK